MSNQQSNMHSQSGATLIEAMISLVVFAVGALGIAALQTTSLVRVDDTRQRSIAIWKAQELADRIRLSITTANPAGNIAQYAAAINNDSSDIGVVSDSNIFVCDTESTPEPRRCDDTAGEDAAACTINQIVASDIWNVMCDNNSGIGAVALEDDEDGLRLADGNVGLRDVELALDAEDGEVLLFLEWQSRSINNNQAAVEAGERGVTVVTNLCGQNFAMDPRVEAYCVKVL